VGGALWRSVCRKEIIADNKQLGNVGGKEEEEGKGGRKRKEEWYSGRYNR